MEKAGNVVVLADFRLNKARLLKERGTFVEHSYWSGKRAPCTVHVLREPGPPPAPQATDDRD